MNRLSRRRLISGGLASAAGVTGLAAATKIAKRYGLVPPDAGGIYGPGETLTYAASRLLNRHSLAREFSRSEISKPFENEVEPLSAEFKRLQEGGFAEWRLVVDGMAARPRSFSVAEIMSLPASSQITQIACEEGWSYVSEWTGLVLAHLLALAEPLPSVRYVVYRSIQPDWWESIDMADALHPQTLVAYAVNGETLPVTLGGPLRLRLPRQLGYKNVKYINRITLTDNLRQFGKGLGSVAPEFGYAWYAGI